MKTNRRGFLGFLGIGAVSTAAGSINPDTLRVPNKPTAAPDNTNNNSDRLDLWAGLLDKNGDEVQYRGYKRQPISIVDHYNINHVEFPVALVNYEIVGWALYYAETGAALCRGQAKLGRGCIG